MKENAKILVVDDSLPALKLVSEIVLYNGYDVIKTTSGKKAIVYAVEYDPDLIILDIMMPNVDGHTVLNEIKKHDNLKDKPVIMLTASKNVDDVKKSKMAGIADYMLKPISINKFVDRVRNLVPLTSYENVGAYLNGDNFINEQDEDSDLSMVYEEIEKITHKKENAGMIKKVIKKEKRVHEIEVIDGYPVKYYRFSELKPGMIPAKQIITKGGTVVHPAGVELNEKVIEKIKDFEFDKEKIPVRG
jgi:DNA-binding response OmpR family regulator